MRHHAIRIGLVGTGRIGRLHAASIAANPQTELTWVADPSLDCARAVSARFGGSATGRAVEILDPNKVDAVLIASPTPTHIELIEACVDARLPVLCEKPIDLDIARVEVLRPKVAASKVPVALGFNQRFDPAFAEVHGRIMAGEIGGLEQLLIISRDPSPPPAAYVAVSGGIFRDMTIHDLDLSRFILGDVVEVSATGACLFDRGADEHGDFDTVVVTLQSAAGATATVMNSRHSSIGYDQRMEAFGATGVLQVENAHTGLVTRSAASGVEVRSRYVESFLDRYAIAYARELEEFVKLVRGEESSSPTFEDGRAALILADAAQRSAEERVAVRIEAT